MKVMNAITAAAHRLSAAMWRVARTAPIRSMPITPAATAIVRSAKAWRRATGWQTRQSELLPVGYYHVVFTLPAEIAAIAYQNKQVVYDLLFKASAQTMLTQTMLTIAADPKHLGAKIAITAVLHTWGSALTHHPHVHMIVPGGGLSEDGKRWIACRRGFFLPVRVLAQTVPAAVHRKARCRPYGRKAA